jgi:transposase
VGRDVQATGPHELRGFSRNLGRDWDAVHAGLTKRWSSGSVEGHVYKLKVIKRQMYGRANFDLLRKRVLMAT